MISWFHTTCGGWNQGVDAGAGHAPGCTGPGDGPGMGTLVHGGGTTSQATLAPPRSPSPRLGLSPRRAEPRGAPKRRAGGGNQRRDDALGCAACVGACPRGCRGGPGCVARFAGGAPGGPAGGRGHGCDRVAHKRPACGGGGAPIEWPGRAGCARPHGRVAGLGQEAGACPARRCARWAARLDARPRALRARWEPRAAALGHEARVGTPDAPAGVRRAGACGLGDRRERLWR
jgi:hypothetical protein